MIQKGGDGFYHPAAENEISDLIKYAAAQGLKVRVRGAAHSAPPGIILTGNFKTPPPGDPNINMLLDKMAQVHFYDATKQVTAQAGCHLGRDPFDPTKTSTRANSLFYLVDQHGWAFPITGGISQQTVGGFVSTGSAGGTMRYSFGRQIIAIRLVDGLGNIQEYRKTDNLDDPFYGVCVSMGLLGIVTAVTFQCVDRFALKGVETTSSYAACKIDLFGTGQAGKPSLETFSRDHEYTRQMWFPQRGVEKIIVWEAERIEPIPADFKPKPYTEFPVILGSEVLAQFVSSLLFQMFDLMNPPEPSSRLGKFFKRLITPLYAPTVNNFLASEILGPQHFQDIWWDGLPMDDKVNYAWLPTEFTELWYAVDKTADVMREYLAYYRGGGYPATGVYTAELYCTPSNNFWMSPAYQQDVFRADQFWFAKNRGEPDRDFYPPLWNRMKKFNFRPHWGKYLPLDVAYLRAQYVRWDDFMNLRARLDPQQLFVTDYWRLHLGIAPR